MDCQFSYTSNLMGPIRLDLWGSSEIMVVLRIEEALVEDEVQFSGRNIVISCSLRPQLNKLTQLCNLAWELAFRMATTWKSFFTMYANPRPFPSCANHVDLPDGQLEKKLEGKISQSQPSHPSLRPQITEWQHRLCRTSLHSHVRCLIAVCESIEGFEAEKFLPKKQLLVGTTTISSNETTSLAGCPCYIR
jgi:hypothetical protein